MSLLRRLWDRRERRPVFVGVTLLAVGVFLVYPFVDYWLRSAGVASEFVFRDYGAYDAAVERWLNGEAIYQRREDGGFHGTYLYPPVVLFLFWPFATQLPFRTAAMCWMTLSVAVLWVGLQALVAAVRKGSCVANGQNRKRTTGGDRKSVV